MKNFDKIKTYKEIKYITKVGKKIILHSAIIYKGRAVEDKAKIGILISRKFGNAVKRNKAKRRILSALNYVNYVNYREVVLIPKKNLLLMNFEDLKSEIESLFI